MDDQPIRWQRLGGGRLVPITDVQVVHERGHVVDSQTIFYPQYTLAEDTTNAAAVNKAVNSLVRAENKWSNWQWENTLTYQKGLNLATT